MVEGHEAVAEMTARAAAALFLRVQAVTEDDIQADWIRVPLDVQRTEMRSLQWRPPCLKRFFL